MKQVYSNDEIAHVWVHNGQDSARNPGGSMSFNGDKFYSYNTVIARRYGNIILMSSRTYSVTTAKHQGKIKNAARGPVVYCNDVNNTPADNFAELTSTVIACIKKQERAKKVDYILQADRAINTFKKYAALIGYKMPADTVEGIAAAEGARIKKQDAARARAKRERMKEAKEFVASLDLKQIERAYNVARAAYHGRHDKSYRAIMTKLDHIAYKARDHGVKIPVNVYPDLMRVSRDGGVITSRGVNITVEEARGLYLALKAGKDITGERISHYRIDTITPDYVKAGCHTFPRDELSYISLKLFGEAV